MVCHGSILVMRKSWLSDDFCSFLAFGTGAVHSYPRHPYSPFSVLARSQNPTEHTRAKRKWTTSIQCETTPSKRFARSLAPAPGATRNDKLRAHEAERKDRRVVQDTAACEDKRNPTGSI